MAPITERTGVEETAHSNVVRVDNEMALEGLRRHLSRLDLSLEEFCRLGARDELEDDRARVLWLMYGPDLCR